MGCGVWVVEWVTCKTGHALRVRQRSAISECVKDVSGGGGGGHEEGDALANGGEGGGEGGGAGGGGLRKLELQRPVDVV